MNRWKSLLGVFAVAAMALVPSVTGAQASTASTSSSTQAVASAAAATHITLVMPATDQACHVAQSQHVCSDDDTVTVGGHTTLRWDVSDCGNVRGPSSPWRDRWFAAISKAHPTGHLRFVFHTLGDKWFAVEGGCTGSVTIHVVPRQVFMQSLGVPGQYALGA